MTDEKVLKERESGSWQKALRMLIYTLLGAIAFYTCFPIPHHWRLEFNGIARWIVIVGLFIGGLLGLLDWGLAWVGMPLLTRSALIVAIWVGFTGGLHLDGVMDTADGLAVLDPRRRLQVMADSHTGAFGVMAAVTVLLLKTVALADMVSNRWLALMVAAGWGRWGQLVAIARYPYLRSEGKGALHKASIRSIGETIPSLLLLLGLSGLQFCLQLTGWPGAIGTALGGGAIAFATGAWFNLKLGGHTGDTYGATVEWTEALLLCWFTVIL